MQNMGAFNREVGSRIREVRKSQGRSIIWVEGELCKLGLKARENWLNNREMGKVQITVEDLFYISRVLGVSNDIFLSKKLRNNE